MARIVVSYRRLDSAAIAGRIFDRLSQRYGADSVFMDIDNIPAGVDFRHRISEALHASDALVVVLGPKWLNPKKRGHTTIHDETDWVRIELETALQQKVPVIPALVAGATMPKADQLPPSLRDFAFRNAAMIDAGQDFNSHIERLTRAIDQMLPSPGQDDKTPKAPVSLPAKNVRWYAGGAAAAALVVLAAVAYAFLGPPEYRLPLEPASNRQSKPDPDKSIWVFHWPWSERPAQVAQPQTVNQTTPYVSIVPQAVALSAGEIIAKYAHSTVMITGSWLLFDAESGLPVYQKTLLSGGERLPAYVRLSNNAVVRWLTTSNPDGNNIKIGAAQPGTGFVADPRGFIITNKHIVAPWSTYFPPAEQAGFLVSGDGMSAPQRIDVGNSETDALWKWIPESDGGYVFDSAKPAMLGNSPRNLRGKADTLSVRFTGSKLEINAEIVRSSPDVDLALIKIYPPEPLEPLPLSSERQTAVGSRIMVLGYPPPTASLVAAYPSERTYLRAATAPAPTASEGIVMRVTPPPHLASLGDVVQLSVSGAASGSPVFDAEGRVMGVVAYTIAGATYAVPISHAGALLRPQRSQ